MNSFSPRITASLLCVAFVATGCASRGFVRQEIESLHEQDRELEAGLERTQTQLTETDQRLSGELAAQDEQLEELSGTAKDALDRAIAAGKLAEGKMLFETVLSDDRVKFGFDHTDLSDEARGALDELGSRLTEVDREVYLEVQGHTDATGEENYNLQLGEKRAENVRRYLNMEHSIPLHRMATISYGEAAPVADNTTREGRAKNRRVVVVVLR